METDQEGVLEAEMPCAVSDAAIKSGMRGRLVPISCLRHDFFRD